MKDLPFYLLYCCVNVLLQTLTTSSSSSSSSSTAVELLLNSPSSSSCANFPLLSESCDPSSRSNLDKQHCVTKREDSAWAFDESTLFLPILANSCSLEIYPKQPDRRSYVSTYNISSVGITQKDNTYYLHTQSVISASNSCQFVLQLTLGAGNPGNACKYYKHYNLVGTSQRDIRASFKDECLVELDTDAVYDITVTDSQTNLTRIFRFFTPSQLFADQVPADASYWRTLIGVSLHFNSLTIYTQPIPHSYSYLLHITYSKGAEVLLEGSFQRWLPPGGSAVSFESAGELTYNINLRRCNKRASNSDQSDPTDADACESIQYHQLISPEISTIEQRQVTALMASSTASTEDVAVVKSEVPLKKQELYILVGTIVGVVALAVVIVVVVCIYFKRRHGSHHGLTARFSGGNVYSDGILFEEDVKGSPPSILLLYSYDCQQHLACVQSLALLLQNSLGCSVMADFWATQEIAERGIYMWLQHKMATVNYVIVVCSTGARFKSVTNRRARLEQTADDAYLVAMRLLQAQADCSESQKMVVYFDYSCESDIPVTLESWQRYKLLQDVQLLISTVIEDECKDKGSKQCKDSPQQIYIQILKEKIDFAKRYMDENPDWFHQNLRSDLSDDASPISIPPMIRLSQQLPVVTVEYSGDRQQRDEVDNKLVHKSNSVPRTVSPATTWSRQSAHRSDPDTHSNVGSYSSSLEDLEHDIDFILNPSLPSRVAFGATSNTFHPSLPSRARFVSSPQALVDMLPDGAPTSNGYHSSILLPQLPQLKLTDDGASSCVGRAVCQES